MKIGEFKRFIEDQKLADDRELVIEPVTTVTYKIGIKPLPEAENKTDKTVTPSDAS